jgi:hypothetical protein
MKLRAEFRRVLATANPDERRDAIEAIAQIMASEGATPIELKEIEQLTEALGELTERRSSPH